MLIFEKGSKGRHTSYLPKCDVKEIEPGERDKRSSALNMPELSENDVCRHYSELERKTYGVNNGFYPLGSCTMKYNPKIDEAMAGLDGFTSIHPLAPEEDVQGCINVIAELEKDLCAITGMKRFTMQPAAGAHGEFTGLLLIKAYHDANHDNKRTKIIIPDSAHGTNPASASMAGYDVVNIASNSEGCIDLEMLKSVCDDTVAGLMLTNPNTVGLFDKNIENITSMIHSAGGLCYYDGANLNAVMGIVRPGDIGFDCMHINLHKTFATPHGGGGPGSGPVGCCDKLVQFLPGLLPEYNEKTGLYVLRRQKNSIGDVRSYYGNFLVVLKALTYITTLGKEGIKEASSHAVLAANYMMASLKDTYHMPYDRLCMHEFVMSLEDIKEKTGVSALDIAKGLLDMGIHPPTMYFPLIVHEALMLEPCETESKEVMDAAINAFKTLKESACKTPLSLHEAPKHTTVARLDEVMAARHPKLRWVKP